MRSIRGEESMKILYRFLNPSKNPKGYSGLFLTALVTNTLLVVVPVIQKTLLNNIMAGKLLQTDILAFLVISFSLIVVSLIEICILIQVKYWLQKNVTLDLLESLSILESPVIRTRGSGAFMSSVFGDAEQISNQLLGSNLFLGIGNVFSVLVILVITYRWMKIFPVFVLVSYGIAVLAMKAIQKKRAFYFDKGREEIYKLNPIMLETIENRTALMNHATWNTRTKMIIDQIRERDRNFYRSSVWSKLGSGCIDSVKQIFLVLFFVVAMYQILDKRLELSSFVAITSYFQAVYLPLYFFKSLSDSKTLVEVLYRRNQSFFDAKPRLLLPQGFHVSLQDVSLHYGETPILKQVHLELDRMYGIVGLSGEGKSSLFSLLLGEERPSSGSVLVGKHDASAYDLHMRLNLFKYYPQENELFDADLQYNLALGKKPLSLEQFQEEESNLLVTLQQIRSGADVSGSSAYESILNTFQVSRSQSARSFCQQELQPQLQMLDLAQLQELAQMIAAHQYYVQEEYDRLIAAFGLEGLKDRTFGQRGSQISGGEKNKICMARLLLTRGAAPFLIDEPFTSLDLISESQNVAVLQEYLRGQKGLIISHKIDLLKKLTDEILVIREGMVEAVGAHSHLLEISPTYRRLYEEYLKKNQEYVQSP